MLLSSWEKVLAKSLRAFFEFSICMWPILLGPPKSPAGEFGNSSELALQEDERA
jgi:hypothetical protein